MPEDHQKPSDFEDTLYRAERSSPDSLPVASIWGMGTTPVAAAASAWVCANLGKLWCSGDSRT